VNVQSVLGETLRAEIEVTSLNAEEASSLQVHLASPEAFRAAGVDYNPVLVGAKLTLSSRGADRTPVLVLTSDRVVQEPFVDVIVDFTWSTGRLSRSYTLLIDPPGRNVAAQPATAPVAPVFSSPAPAARATASSAQSTQVAQAPVAQAPAQAPTVTTPAPRPAPSATPAPAPAPVARTPHAAAPAPAPAATPTPAPEGGASGETVKVHPGDTLGSIAAAKKESGVSLDQMLVSLFRSNPQAFIDDNMNRMKSGVTLAVPTADAAKQLSTQEAHQIIQAQSADFAAYRQRLAGGVPTVKTGEGTRQASGKVEAQIRDEKTASAPPAPEKLTLSHGSAKPGTATQEAKISKETQRQAEAARVAELSRNVAELKKLTAGTAPAAAPATTTAPAAAPAVPALTVARATPVVAPTASAAAAPKPAPATVPSAAAPALVPPVATLPASTATPALAASVAAPVAVASSAPAGASAPLAAASTPVARPQPRPHPVAQPKPAEEESFLSELTDSPYVIPGLAVIVAALGGLAFWRKRKGGRKGSSGETSFMESKIQPDSFFGVSGGQRVDTRDGASTTSSASSSLNYSLSQLDAIGDVDPVAEADVYLAYGRDLQAEEILKEAQRSDPDRLAIRTKLLEVYAKRADLKTFETQARQLRDLTNGYGEDWAKAQELGRQIDPTNPLYREGDYGTEDTEPTPLEPLPPEADAVLNQAVAATAPVTHSEFESTDLPLPLDLEMDAPAPAPAERAAPAPAAAPVAAPVAAMEDLSFQVSDFRLDAAPEVPTIVEPTPTAPMPALATAAAPRGAEEPASLLPPSIDFDFGELSLDLDPPADHAAERAAERAIAAAAEASVPELDLGEGDVNEPMARKIELADEFRRIGDHEGARDLLEEVVSKADGSLRSRAQTMLDALG
jgi:pilus assembly protein FimV